MFLDLNQLEKAESWYMKTLELDGDHAAAYNNLAVLRERQDRLAEALLAFERAAEIDATEVVYPCNAGYVLRRLARYEDANRRYRSVIDLNPDDPQGYCGLAWALWEAGGDLGEAEMLARKAVALRPDDIDTAHALATVLSERSGGASMESIRRWFAVASTDEHWWTPARHRDVIPTLAAAVVAGRAREIVSELQGLGPPSCWRPYMEAVAELLGGEGNDSTAAMEPNSISAQLAFAVKARGMNSKQTEQKSQLRT
jgi:tetratricopeptide (TPR) repeat protein